MHWYFRDLLGAFEAAAEMRFGAPYWLRYDLDEDSPPGTNFRERFAGREGLVSLYAMAARQADVLAEYLCLYRVLEAADLRNGTHFAETRIPLLREHRFGVLRVATTITDSSWVNAFEIYKSRAFVQLRRLERHGTKSPRDVAAHLYELRNALAHGKVGVKTSDFGAGVHQVAGALPIVKLLARMAVEP